MGEEVVVIMIPLIGTAIGSACVFFMSREPGKHSREVLLGFSGGIMTAASVWSLLLPAIDRGIYMGRWSFVPATGGFLLGIFGMIWIERIIEKRLRGESRSMMMTAVVLHNIPEGVAVGVAFAVAAAGDGSMTAAGATALALGIAIQNFPEGAIVSMPLRSLGMSKWKSFIYGVLSGAVEPIGAAAAIIFSEAAVPILPYLLSIAAGTMIYAVISELVPEMTESGRKSRGVIAFGFGFAVMMALDCFFG